jgi:hypothetical protein
VRDAQIRDVAYKQGLTSNIKIDRADWKENAPALNRCEVLPGP